MKVKICLEELSFGGNRQIMLDYTRFRNQLFFWSLEREKSFLTVHLFVHVDGTIFFCYLQNRKKMKRNQIFHHSNEGKINEKLVSFLFFCEFFIFFASVCNNIWTISFLCVFLLQLFFVQIISYLEILF